MEFMHELFKLFLDNLGPIVLIVCLVTGVGAGSFVWIRSRARREMASEVSTYAEALKDVSLALKTSNETLAAMQKELSQSRETNRELSEQNKRQAQALEAATRQLEALNTQIKEYQTTISRMAGEMAAEKRMHNETIAALNAKVTALQNEVDALREKLAQNDRDHALEIDRLKALLEQSETARRLAEDRLHQLQADIDSLRRALADAADGKRSESGLPDSKDGHQALEHADNLPPLAAESSVDVVRPIQEL